MKNKILIDTNFILDAMLPDRPNSQSAFVLYQKALHRELTCEIAVCAGSLKNAYYIARKDITEPERRQWIRGFIAAFTILPIDTKTCNEAVNSDEPDFEDGIIRACAERWQADCLVSRDAKAFLNSSVPKISSDEFVSNLESNPLEG